LARHDLIAGFTRLPDLLEDYYAVAGSPLYERLADNGVWAVFLSLPRTHPEEYRRDLDLRNEIADRLEDEILGEAGSGREIGIVLGQAIGLDFCYIDLLLYDERSFLDQVGQVLGDYGPDITLREYRPGSSAILLQEPPGNTA
jgi:tetrahydromethanopterin S-methyltransferase subunit G